MVRAMGRPEPAIYEEPSDDEPGVFDVYDEAFEAKRDAEGEADFQAGRYVSHEAVRRWLLSWGTDNELPAPNVGD